MAFSITEISDFIVSYKDDESLCRCLFNVMEKHCIHEDDGESLLHTLIRKDLKECLNEYVDRGLVNLDDYDYGSYDEEISLVTFAVEESIGYDCLKYLLACGFDVNGGSSFTRMTPLQSACCSEDWGSVTILLEHKPNLSLVPDKVWELYQDSCRSRDTPLIIATKRKDKKIMKLLLDAGADIEEENDIGETALSAAGGDLSILKLLVPRDDDDDDDKPSPKRTRRDECVVCLKSGKDLLFMPCAHLACCSACGNKAAMTNCPVCRVKIDKKIKVYN